MVETHMKVALVCSHGGHLDEALAVLEAFAGHEVFLVTYDASVMGNPNLKDFSHPGIARTYRLRLRGISNFLIFLTMAEACFRFLWIFLKERPKMVFSTGSEIALPAFYLGKFLFRVRLIFLETATRVTDPSLTGKVLYPVADLFLVQWEAMLAKLGPKARYHGGVF
jgi:UDP-N-acetylglucosamine:LPS N-acetylglucosamine transferase